MLRQRIFAQAQKLSEARVKSQVAEAAMMETLRAQLTH